ncbi:MAG: hypothetical protein RBR78_11570 [Flavobacteriaceae bacterium]|jgi:hypothetical protein|nr:hypothetical protein [Flavobacteriaceae bacterium]
MSFCFFSLNLARTLVYADAQRFEALRRSGLERLNFQLSTNVAKPFFLFAKLQKRANKKWFLRIESTNVEVCT